MTDVDDFLAHYGVKGMRWGKRKLSARQKAVEPAKKIGTAIGAAAGVAGAAGFVSKGSKILRSKKFNKILVDNAVNKGVKRIGFDSPGIRGLLEDGYSRKIIKENFRVADLMTNPVNVAKITVGAAAVSAIIGSTVAVRIKQNQIDKKKQEGLDD